ncbi:hypothetical protein GCM10020000_51260 [Streptomyces olivoverticillatus]
MEGRSVTRTGRGRRRHVPQHRRPTAAAALLLLLSVLLGPALWGPGPAAYASAGEQVTAALAHGPAGGSPAPEVRPHAGTAGTGGTCRQQDVPLKGAEGIVTHVQTDPPSPRRAPHGRRSPPDPAAPGPRAEGTARARRGLRRAAPRPTDLGPPPSRPATGPRCGMP